MAEIHGWATHGPRQKLEPFAYDAGPLGLEEVEIAVEYCGLCHSDLSIVNDDWGMSQYPVIPGHEAVGKIVALGDYAKGLRIGSANQRGPKSKGADSEASPQVKGDQSNSISGIGSACNSHWVIAS